MKINTFDYESAHQQMLHFLGNDKNLVISILVHNNPDGDALSAGLALCMVLKKMLHNVKIIAPNKYSDNLKWLPQIENVFICNTIFQETIISHVKKSSHIICIDFSRKSRTDSNIVQLLKDKNILVIDHHQDKPEFQTDHVIHNPNASSSSEIVFELLERGFAQYIDEDVAKCIYTGIMTDTDRFTTSNVSYRVHEIVGKLLHNYDIPVSNIYNAIYSISFNRMKFIGFIFDQCVSIIQNTKVAYVVINKSIIKKYGLNTEDTNGIVNDVLLLKNIVMVALFKSDDQGIRISFRSKGNFDVNEFAKKNFNGGGHKNASGGVSRLPLKVTINKFISIIKSIDELKYV